MEARKTAQKRDLGGDSSALGTRGVAHQAPPLRGQTYEVK